MKIQINPRILKPILAGVGVTALATTLALQVATLNVATSAAQIAESATTIAQFANEVPAARKQTITEELPGFYAVYTRHHSVQWDTISITYEKADGAPLTSGGFEASQGNGNGLFISPLDGTPAGDYRVVVNQLSPSEITHPLIFLVTVE
jgi:hypothetical protein